MLLFSLCKHVHSHAWLAQLARRTLWQELISGETANDCATPVHPNPNFLLRIFVLVTGMSRGWALQTETALQRNSLQNVIGPQSCGKLLTLSLVSARSSATIFLCSRHSEW